MSKLGKIEYRKKAQLLPSFAWTLFFAVFCGAVHVHAMDRKTKACEELASKIKELEQVRQSALEEREDLALQINSQNDESWIEMVLKKRLGVVPEGQMKVYFKNDR